MFITYVILFLTIRRRIGKKLATGQNYIVKEFSHSSVHAEHDAINHLNVRYILNEKLKIDFVVFRMRRDGTMGYSRPCENCLIRMTKSGLNISNVYYSNINGDIVHEKFKYMLNSPLTSKTTGDAVGKIEK